MLKSIRIVSSVFFILLFVCYRAIAVPLEEKGVQKSILNTFKHYDSVILFNAVPNKLPMFNTYYWGMGYKNGETYKLVYSMRFLGRENKPVQIRIRKIEVVKWNSDDSLFSKMNTQKLIGLSKDSLNDFTEKNSKIRRMISGGTEYSFLVFKSSTLRSKCAYMVKMYQKLSPNADRAYYLDMVYEFRRVFNLDFYME